MSLTAEQYWKFRAEESDRQRVQEQAETAIAQVAQARKAAFDALGLSVNKRYKLDDTACTIEEVTE